MRTAVALLVVLLTSLLCVACGGSRQSISVGEAERVFAAHGLPLTREVTPVANHPFGLPRTQERLLDRRVRAILYANATNHGSSSTRDVIIFDSTASLRLASQLAPGIFKNRLARRTVTGSVTTESGCTIQRENVFAIASYDECARVRAIMADLH